MLINLNAVINSRYICTSNNQTVYFKYTQLLTVEQKNKQYIEFYVYKIESLLTCMYIFTYKESQFS